MAEVRVRLPLGAPSIVDCGLWIADCGLPEIRNQQSEIPRCGGACVGTGRRLLSVTSQVRFQPPQLAATKETEVIRLDEEPVLKTGGGTDRVWVRVGYRRAAWVASADRRHDTRPWCNWQHDWLQPSWSGFKSLGACLVFVRGPWSVVRGHESLVIGGT